VSLKKWAWVVIAVWLASYGLTLAVVIGALK